MLTVEEAVKRASEVVAGMFPSVNDLRLEEVEMSDDGPWWDVTLSFPQASDNPFETLTGKANRAYKLVRLNRDTGEFHAVKIRKI